MQPAPPRQGWQEFDVGGMISPIVDDEGCDFLCSEKHTLAELIEIEARRQGMAGGDAGGAVGSAAYLPCWLVRW